MAMRSLLLVSPDSDEALARAAAAGADGLVIDLAGAETSGIERTIALISGTTGGNTMFVRVGPLAAPRTTATLDAIMPARPGGIVLAATQGGADVTRLSALLRPREAMAGIADGATRIVACVTDTPAALFAFGSYAGASRRLVGLAWDTRHLADALAAEDLSEVEPIARTGTLIAAATAGVVAVDRPFRGADLGALEQEAVAARRRGFRAKLAVDAAQIPVINAVFSRAAPSNR